LEAILADFGVTNANTSQVDGFAGGYIIEDPTSLRSVLEPILALFGVEAFENGDRLIFRSSARLIRQAAQIAEFVEPEEHGPVIWRIQEMMDQPSRVEIAYRDPMLDYQAAMAFAERPDGRGTENIAIPGMIDSGQAKSLAEEWLQTRLASRRTAAFELPWKQAGLRVGDRVRILVSASAPDFVVTSIEDGATRRIEARALPQHARYPDRAELPVSSPTASAIRGRPYFHLLDLPMWPGVEKPVDQFRVAAFAKPWSGVSVFASPEMSGFEPRATLGNRAVMGELVTELRAGLSGRLAKNQALDVELYYGELSSVTLTQMLNGANSAILATPEGGWEVLQFLNAEEIQPDRWRLTGLLRGQCGTEREAMRPRPEGMPFILLDEGVKPAGLKTQEASLELYWRIGASGEDFSDQFFHTVSKAGGLRALLPLEPVHVRSRTDSNGDINISWIRRGRVDADSWLAAEIPVGEEREAYRIEIRKDERLLRSADVDSTNWSYTKAQRLSDFDSLDAEFDFSVAMISAVVGPGRRAHKIISQSI
jgi:hypothetical protein